MLFPNRDVMLIPLMYTHEAAVEPLLKWRWLGPPLHVWDI